MSPRVAASPVQGLPLIQCVRCVIVSPFPGALDASLSPDCGWRQVTRCLRTWPPQPGHLSRASVVAGIMPAMMIGVGLDARLGLSFGQLREMGREAERLGFESLWSPYVGVPDAFHICAAWGQDTGLRTGISVVPAALLWTPAALAMQAATVAQLSDGRFVLGLGTGGVGPGFWAAAGLPDRPIAVMRKYTTSVHELLAGQAVSSDGLTLGPRTSALRAAGLPRVPVYLAALGPQMLRLAGEVADGVLLNWATPDRIAASRELVADGARRAGR